MAKRRTPRTNTPEPPEGLGYLLVPNEQFAQELDEQIEQGQSLVDREIASMPDLEAAKSDYYTWNDYNEELLKRRFTTTTIADDYSHFLGIGGGYFDGFVQKLEDYRSDVKGKIRRLTSIRERLPLFEEAASVRRAEEPPPRAPRDQATETIFIVHGHAEAPKLAVHGFLRDLTDLEPVILHDAPSKGRTIIEKFEAVGATAGFAVVILTGDDVARVAADEAAELRPRARQNVVFEYGFFVGALGRSHVAVLYEDGVERPSDIDGLVYIPYDGRGAWKVLLARELNAAGIVVDANKLL